MSKEVKKILVAVTTDVVSDMRVRKTCDFLLLKGAKITVVGRRMSSSFNFDLPFGYKLFNLFFNKGVFFYAEYNFRFFILALFKRFDVIVSNDLDTLLPCYLLSKIKRAELVYDSHEYFTESAGLIGRSAPKKVWLMIERFIFPKLKRVSTVNESIAGIYSNKYGNEVRVIRNVPKFSSPIKMKTKTDLGISNSQKMVLLQGGYIDKDRGGVELVKSAQFLSDEVVLYIIGAGQEIPEMKSLTKILNLEHKIFFLNKLPYEKLEQYTLNADLAVSIDKPSNLNYKYSLPNKIFDYFKCGVPIVASRLPEIEKIYQKFSFGLLIDDYSPENIAINIEQALYSKDYHTWKNNLIEASKYYTWENEIAELERLYSGIF